MTIIDEKGKVMQRGGEAALKQMRKQENSNLTTALAGKVNQLFASFNKKFEASRREETRKADEAIRMMKEENAELRRQMLAMESARLEQDRKMGIVMEGIMVRLGGLPLPEAVAMTPPRGGAGQNAAQQWAESNSLCPPSSQQAGGAPHQGREPPAIATRPAARRAVLLPATEGEAARGREVEAAMKAMVSTGGEALLQLLKNSGHQEVVSILTMEGSWPSTQK